MRVSEYKNARAHPRVVYAVRLFPESRIKIGTTRNRYNLLKEYRRIVPEAELIWEHSGGFTFEKALHEELAAFNVPHVSGIPSEVFDFGIDDHLALEHITRAAERVLAKQPDIHRAAAEADPAAASYLRRTGRVPA